MLNFTALKTPEYKAPYYLGRYCEVFGLPPAKFKFNTLLSFAEQGALLNSMGITFQDPDGVEPDTWQIFSSERSTHPVSESRLLRHPLITGIFKSAACKPSARFHAYLLLPFVEIYAAHRLGCSMPGHVLVFDELEGYIKNRKRNAELLSTEGHVQPATSPGGGINNANMDTVVTALKPTQNPAVDGPLSSPAGPANPHAHSLHWARGGDAADESHEPGDPEQGGFNQVEGESLLPRDDFAQTHDDGVPVGTLPKASPLSEQGVQVEVSRESHTGADNRDVPAAMAKELSGPSPTRQDTAKSSGGSSLVGGESTDENDHRVDEIREDVMSIFRNPKG